MEITDQIRNLAGLPLDQRIEAINQIKDAILEVSPFATEPVERVRWVKSDLVNANDYNPNSVAPPEMELLRHSISEDGYTQPIVAWDDQGDGTHYTVIDGFHRHRVGKECPEVQSRIHGYLPVVIINADCSDRNHRIASTIRHNRARGKHKVEAMSDIVIELKRRNWTDARICKELGMDQDEVLRLCQITGLQEMFGDADFSQSWVAEGEITEDDFTGIDDSVPDNHDFNKVPNTSDPERIFHTYDKWECYKAGFYEGSNGMKKADAEQLYCEFLSNDHEFRSAIERVFTEWPNSCEHYLSNAAMNRIAWIGQAAACIAKGLPSTFRSGFFLMTQEAQDVANQTAYEYLCRWLSDRNMTIPTFEEAYAGRQSDIY